jgi:hypothetical protein
MLGNPSSPRHSCISSLSLQFIFSRKNTEGDALCVPLSVAFFGLLFRYFFFAAFFAAFFAGAFLAAFLAAFLVAICLFSLFDGLHRFCNEYIAVEECIELCGIDVKKKTTCEWKNRQQFFLSPSCLPLRFTGFSPSLDLSKSVLA